MPPCISQLEGGLVQVAIEVEDRAHRSAITSNFAVWLIILQDSLEVIVISSRADAFLKSTSKKWHQFYETTCEISW